MSVAGKAPGLPWRVATQTKTPKQRRGGSSYRLLDPVSSPLLSQHYSTAAPSAERYGKRYEVEGRTNFRERRLGDVRRRNFFYEDARTG
jgi:hypothetical protein